MRRGPTPSSESIFLDYISPWNVISLYKSLKKKHFLVSLCTGGSLLLRASTLFSTALFELRSVPIAHQANFSIPQGFSDSKFDPSFGHETIYAACSAFATYNLTRPFGLHETFVYTPFYPADSYATGNTTLPVGHYYDAEIELIEPFLECQDATATWETGMQVGQVNSNFTTTYFESNTTALSSDGCHFQIEPRDVEDDLLLYNNTVSMEIYIRGCNGELPINPEDMHYIGPSRDDWRIWAAVINPINANSSRDHPYTRTYNGSGDHVLTSTWPTPPFHAVMCKPRFNAYRGPVSIWRQPGESAITADIRRESLKTSEIFPQLPAGRILFSAFQSLSAGPSQGAPDQISTPDFRFMGHQNVSTQVYWDDMSLFVKRLQDDFACVMRQTIMSELFEPELQHIQGVTTSIETRLFVRVLSFGLLLGLLVSMIAICIVLLIFYVPVTACPWDTSSIMGMTSVFAQSPEFMTLFDGSDLKTESRMAESGLGQAHYSSTETEGRLKLLFQDDLMSDRDPSKDTEASPSWWYPLSSTLSVRASVVAIPILVIIALEIVQHISNSSRGITFIGDKSSFIHYVWIYVPAFVMFTIRCLFSCIEFGARVFQPYSVLREGNASPESTIKENQLRKIAIYGLFDNLRKRQWALAAATASLFLAAILPVVVSGLYTVQTSWPTSPIELVQSGRWNLGDPATASQGFNMQWTKSLVYGPEGESNKIAGLIIQLNLTYPKWTHNNLAFPGFSVTDPIETQRTGYIDIRLPALRSKLDCAEAQVHCEAELKYNLPTLRCDGRAEVSSLDQTNGSTGYFYQTDDLSTTSGTLVSAQSFVYGKWNENVQSTEYHWFDCDATLEEVDVDTRLHIPSFSIDSDSPPSVVPNSNRTIFKTGSWAFPSLGEIATTLLSEVSTGRQGPYTIFEALVNGTGGVPAKELLDPKIMAERVDTIWGITLAQLLVHHAQEEFQDPFNTSWFVHPATKEAPRYAGIFHDGRDFLVQNTISTRILDGLLGGMILCALVALFSMRTKEVLPKSPCSIASVASFVAGSTFLGMMKDTGLQEKDWSQRSFSMGWWKVERGATSDYSTSGAPSLSGNREHLGQVESNESILDNEEPTNSSSVHSNTNLSSTSARRDEEIEEIGPTSTAESREGATPGNQSVHLRSEASMLLSNEEAELEAGQTLTRFGIDIDGYRRLLDDVE